MPAAASSRVASFIRRRFQRFSAFGQDFGNAGADALQGLLQANNHLGRVTMKFGLNDLLDAIVVALLGLGTAWVALTIAIGAV
jgi:hypothetical protein